ncbi:hypothetical protein [Thermostaphylospora chromogena]|uniref:Uncharacterized protein n=1 Tax=Thermostaphylospora chromogena TaxID=35622 RepID=A0A1H1HJC5_9ACTN|nr:hypothetical protein [Thermostaphylospora chromogena]SDR25610.1 hypothetical protein SAMN04489764_4513 [Thermostaphylospora chromogena]
MKLRVATALVAAAVGASVLATASPAQASPIDVGPTRLHFDAGPEPIRKHGTLRLKGKLEVDCKNDYIEDFTSVHFADSCEDYAREHRLGYKKLDILFQPSGRHRWYHVRTIKTNRDGRFFTTVSAHHSGTWKVVFKGARRLGPSEASDYVKVYRHKHHHRHHRH